MKKYFAAAVILLSGCATTLETEKHGNLTGEQRNETALKAVKVMSSDQSMDKFFAQDRALKNACIVGMHYKMIVNDNTANYKSTTSYSSGPNMRTEHTFSLSYDFKPAPAYFQHYTDFAYNTLATTLKSYGYNVIDAETVKKSAAYNAKGEKGNTSTDTNPQYAGYFDLDAKGLRHYDGNGFSAVRTLASNDEWATQFNKETSCDLMVNATMDGHWKVKGGGEQHGINALVMGTENNFKIDWYTPWPVWEKASKIIGSKIYGAVNRGGNTVLKSPIRTDLVYAMGDNSKASKETLDRVALYTDTQLKNNITMAIEYQVRAFHMEVYKQKSIPNQLATFSNDSSERAPAQAD